MRPDWGPRARRAAGWCLPLFLFVTPFSKSAVEISFPLLLILWLLGWVFPRKAHGPQIPRAMRAILLFLCLYLLVCAASVFYSGFPALSLRGLIRKTLEYALIFLLAADVVEQPSVPHRIHRALIAAGWLVLFYGGIQEWAIHTAMYQVQAVDPIRRQPLDYVRMVGPYENPNDLATFLMVVSLAALAYWFDPAQGARTRSRLLFLVAMIGCLAWTRSMGALLGLLGGVASLAGVCRPRGNALLRMAAATAATLSLFLLLSWEHLGEILALSDVASQDRMAMWKTAWAMIQDRPLVGHGLNTFMANYSAYSVVPHHHPAYAHNCFLQIAAETSLLGLGLFALLLLAMIRLWRRALRRAYHGTQPAPASRPILAGWAAASVAFLIQSLFDTNLYALRQAVLFWSIAGMATGLSVRFLQTEP